LTGMFVVAQAVPADMVRAARGAIGNMASKNAIDGEAGYAPLQTPAREAWSVDQGHGLGTRTIRHSR